MTTTLSAHYMIANIEASTETAAGVKQNTTFLTFGEPPVPRTPHQEAHLVILQLGHQLLHLFMSERERESVPNSNCHIAKSQTSATKDAPL